MTSAHPRIVTPAEWSAARAELLEHEKRLTRAEDALAAERRRLPMVRLRNDYRFTGPDGRVTLLELFGAHSELLVYQFMNAGPNHVCPGCTHFTNSVPSSGVAQLSDRDVGWATVSDMPIDQLRAAWTVNGWLIPYASSQGTTFNEDLGHGGGYSLNVFLRLGAEVYRTYSTGSRGVDRLIFANSYRDLLPYGRREEWEDSPPGWPKRG